MRASNASSIKNPMRSLLKRNFPIVYDIAVFASVIIAEHLDIEIIDDETAYIALHIGNEIENQKENKNKIKTVILCSDYMNLGEKLFLEIQTTLALDIRDMVDQNINLIITTVQLDQELLSQFPNTIVVHIAPFLDNTQRASINKAIETINTDKKRIILKNHFEDYFNKELFIATNEYKTRNDVLAFMSDKMTTLGIVKDDFYEQVISRDSASSTAFGQIAIPHSLYMDSHQTKVFVLISKDGIVWDDKMVNIIFLTAINFKDRTHFPLVYEGIVSLFDSNEGINKLLTIDNFNDFTSFIKCNAY